MDTFAIRELTFYYPEQKTPAIYKLNLTVQQGEFMVLCGPSGCGKSTLLRQLKTTMAPHGYREGTILFNGKPLKEISHREQSSRIGFVLQSPDNQIVTDKVWHELAFGLESLGYDTPTIRRRVAEMASFFGIQNWFYQTVSSLSGGQKQLLNLASVMAMQPSVLILDEPTSQLDPIAAADFLATLGKINRELGTTILLTEHRLEEAMALASRVAVLDHGTLLCAGTPVEVGEKLKHKNHAMFLGMSAAMRVWAAVPNQQPCPVTVRDGRAWLADFAADHFLKELPAENKKEPVVTCIEVHDTWYRYEKEAPDVIKGLNIKIKKGELFALLGGNGTGKSTTLKILAGILRPYRGEIKINGTIGMLPQNPQTLFVKKSVREDLLELLKGKHLSKQEEENRIAQVISVCQIKELLDRHPYDLSGGEQQRVALAKVLLMNPDILLLDEPTKGLDAEYKHVFAQILYTLLCQGVTILMVSHDIEFCAQYAYRCALFFDGNIVTEGTPRMFFSGNSFYTTSANRMAREFIPQAVTAEDIMYVCGGELPDTPTLPEKQNMVSVTKKRDAVEGTYKLPWWRKGVAVISAFVAIFFFFQAIGVTDLTSFVDAEGFTALTMEQLVRYILLLIALFCFALAIQRKAPPVIIQVQKEKRILSKRTIMAAISILCMIPLTLFFGLYYLGGRKYYFIALLILLECMLPFFLVFEGRKPQAKELVIIAVLCAIAVAGRAAFFMLPQLKPVIALTIIAGVALGGETGFLVGAVTMLISNILFSQGPWTPWQMFAAGIIGFLAGILYRKGLLRRSRLSLCLFGALTTIVIYGGIMNPASVLIWSDTINWNMILTYYMTGFPMDLIHAAGTFLFLWFAAEPMLEKLDRIKVKYGLME